MKLAQTIIRLCKEKSISLSRLAKETGVPVQTLHGWTEGRKAVNLVHLKKVAQHLEVPIHELIYGDRDPFESASSEMLKEIFSGDVRVTLHRIERR
jgi:transcriptional regulator with XRE-family HTH domain